MRSTCPSVVDRNNLCYKCGKVGHKALTCNNRVRCPDCVSRSLVADHRVGTEKCAATIGERPNRHMTGLDTIGTTETCAEPVGTLGMPVTAGGGPAGGEEHFTMELC